jgi:hypothetical protein
MGSLVGVIFALIPTRQTRSVASVFHRHATTHGADSTVRHAAEMLLGFEPKTPLDLACRNLQGFGGPADTESRMTRGIVDQ